MKPNQLFETIGNTSFSMSGRMQQSGPVQPHVLIVDSSETIRMLLSHSLRKHHLEVIEACDGRQAFQLAASERQVDAVLMDTQLAFVDGFEVCRRLKNDGEYCGIPVILMTNAGSHEEIEQAISAGADEVLVKPVSLAELRIRVSSLLRTHGQQDHHNRLHGGSSEFREVEDVALSLAHAVAIKNGYGNRHVELVIKYTVAFGKGLGLGLADLKRLHFAAILHNVGKITIPDSICEKPGPFTRQERSLFTQCPAVGNEVCASFQSNSAVLPPSYRDDAVFDGPDFPAGVHREVNAFEAGIVGIVDAYIALTNDRPFRQAKTHGQAIEILIDRARHGVHHPRLAHQFCKWISGVRAQSERASQTTVELNKPITSFDNVVVNSPTPSI